MLWASIKAIRGIRPNILVILVSRILVIKLLAGSTSYYQPISGLLVVRGAFLPRVSPAVIVVEAFQASRAVLEISAYVCLSIGRISGQVDQQPAMAG